MDKPITISSQAEKRRLFAERPENENKRITFSKILCIFSDALLVYCIVLSSISIYSYFKVLESSVNEYTSVMPDLSFIGYIIPAAFVFAGLTHTFYYNKERFANCITLRFEYIKQLLMFKMNSGLYSKEVLESSLDAMIDQAEMEADALVSSDLQSAEMQQDNISV